MRFRVTTVTKLQKATVSSCNYCNLVTHATFLTPSTLGAGHASLHGIALLPGPFGRFDDQPFLDRAGGHADIPDFTIHNRFHPLQIGKEPPLGDRGNVRADAALFLGFATAPDDAALDGAFAGQFTNS